MICFASLGRNIASMLTEVESPDCLCFSVALCRQWASIDIARFN
ncbi:hypothetical protein T11_11194 [Trichinella zimbabwensis]|uniref:Uncharacterized protein n=1 Tax=Trichinella zimbabwensis TaxID=268475 RepID=A0A0V1GAX0_9BILA|nr:hypothetical protein T11_11194 [Trichinella zimbabwensis]